ncbi:MAG: nickel-binding protein [Promethearchaeota archaeon]
MPKYFVIHPITKRIIKGLVNLTPEKNQLFKQLKASCTDDADWVRSWAVADQEKLYCEWDAKNPEAIREIFDKLEGADIEIESIYEMHVLEGEDYKEKVLSEAV